MSWQKHFSAESPAAPLELTSPVYPGIEVVIPFTSMPQVRAAVRDACRLCSGLDASIRIVRIVVVPYPLDLDHPPSPLSFTTEQFGSLACDLPLTIDLRLSRERFSALRGALTERSLVLLASERRPWRTKEERLGRALKSLGYQVLLSYGDFQHA